MTKDLINRNFEIFSVFLFSISIFIWKPGIYVSSGIIIAYMLARLATDSSYRSDLMASKVMRVSMALFVFGLITATIGMQQPDDLLWMARKTLFFPVAGFLFIALVRPENRKSALIGLLLGFWIASVRTLVENWSELGNDRVAGTWPLGTWDTLLGLFFLFLVLIFDSKNLRPLIRTFVIISAVLAAVLLILAGGRGPFLALACAFAVYFVFYKANSRTLLFLVALFGVAVLLGTTVLHDRTQGLMHKFELAADFTDGSNWIRIKLWGIGYEHIKELAVHQPVSLLFGSGSKSYDQMHISFFEAMPYDEEDRKKLIEYGYPSGDAHNNYIDSTLRNGLLWTIAAFAYLVWLTTRSTGTALSHNPAPFVMLIYFMVLAIVYTMVPHFASFFFVLFVALLSKIPPKENGENS